MKKTKTISFSTMLVALLTILTVLLGALFVAKPVNAPVLSADEELIDVILDQESIEISYYDNEGWSAYSNDHRVNWIFQGVYDMSENEVYDEDIGDYKYVTTYTATNYFDLYIEISGSNWNQGRHLSVVVPSTILVTGDGLNNEEIDSSFYTLSTGTYTIRSVKFWDQIGGRVEELSLSTSITVVDDSWIGSQSSSLSDIYYAGTSSQWDVIDGMEYALSGCNLTIHCAGDDTYKNVTVGVADDNWTENTQSSGGSEEPTPATGVELNIGFAVLSLALVGTMFVVVRRKEER